MNFEAELEKRKKYADIVVSSFLPKTGDYPGKLIDALNYAVAAGGKRLRPIIMQDMYAAFGGKSDEIEPFMAAIEYIHTASLVHDDLPSIDNDGYRRGKPTAHTVYGEALGVLCGDALLNYAYEILIKGIINCKNKENAIKAANIIAQKSGIFGMLGGQGIDVEFEKTGKTIDSVAMLDYMYEKKTSALIEASLMAGAAMSGAADNQISLLESCGSEIGLAFQIRDDILDVSYSDEEIGKPSHSDEKNEKVTYVSLLGIDKAQEKVELLTRSAKEKTEGLYCNNEFLKEYITHLEIRRY